MEKQDSYKKQVNRIPEIKIEPMKKKSKGNLAVTQKVIFRGIPLRICQSCGWRWNSFEVRRCPKCGNYT